MLDRARSHGATGLVRDGIFLKGWRTGKHFDRALGFGWMDGWVWRRCGCAGRGGGGWLVLGWVGVGYATVCYGATLWCWRAIPYVDCDRLTSELGKMCVGIIPLIIVLGGKVLGPSAIGNILGLYLLNGFGVAIIIVKILTNL